MENWFEVPEDVFPTDVGMNRVLPRSRSQRRCVPRRRGDEPPDVQVGDDANMCSPQNLTHRVGPGQPPVPRGFSVKQNVPGRLRTQLARPKYAAKRPACSLTQLLRPGKSQSSALYGSLRSKKHRRISSFPGSDPVGPV